MQQIFSERLRAARKKAGLKAKDMAEMLEISAAYLSQLEKGKRDKPNQFLIERAAQILGIPVSQLISSDAATPPPNSPPSRASSAAPPPVDSSAASLSSVQSSPASPDIAALLTEILSRLDRIERQLKGKK